MGVTFALIFVAGLAIGCIAHKLLTKVKPLGFLRIDNSDPDGTYLFLELKEPITSSIVSRKYVTFEVKNENFVKSSRD